MSEEPEARVICDKCGSDQWVQSECIELDGLLVCPECFVPCDLCGTPTWGAGLCDECNDLEW